MRPIDLRDTRRRLLQLAISVLAGLVGSLAIALLLPTRDHFPQPPGSCGFGHWDQGWLVEGGNPTLMLAGTVVLAFGAYAVMRAVVARRERAALAPYGRLVR